MFSYPNAVHKNLHEQPQPSSCGQDPASAPMTRGKIRFWHADTCACLLKANNGTYRNTDYYTATQFYQSAYFIFSLIGGLLSCLHYTKTTSCDPHAAASAASLSAIALPSLPQPTFLAVSGSSHTVDGRNPAPVGNYWQLWNILNNGIVGEVQDFFHPQYVQ